MIMDAAVVRPLTLHSSKAGTERSGLSPYEAHLAPSARPRKVASVSTEARFALLRPTCDTDFRTFYVLLSIWMTGSRYSLSLCFIVSLQRQLWVHAFKPSWVLDAVRASGKMTLFARSQGPSSRAI